MGQTVIHIQMEDPLVARNEIESSITNILV